MKPVTEPMTSPAAPDCRVHAQSTVFSLAPREAGVWGWGEERGGVTMVLHESASRRDFGTALENKYYFLLCGARKHVPLGRTDLSTLATHLT